MPLFFKNMFRTLAISLFCLAATPSFASHLVGDEFTYKYIGDEIISGAVKHHYQVTLNIYEDCMAGTPVAIEEDDPAYFAIYNSSGTLLGVDSVHFASSVSIPGLALGSCGGYGTAPVCLLRKNFIKDYYLESGTSPYTVVYQRCCKNASITNVTDPANAGSTYFCTIPPTSLVASNNCAVFNSYPPVQVELNEPFTYDHSATDADGDSLSYELCNTYSGVDPTNVKPIPPAPPPFAATDYTSPLTYSNPMFCSVALAVDPVTGILSGTPNVVGRYLVAVCCKEWRAGVLINTSQREFEMVVAASGPAYHPIGGPDTTVYVGDSVHFYASNGVSFSWIPGTYLTSSTIPNPVGSFPVAGTFTYVLTGISDSGCSGNDTITVNVLTHSECRMPNAFSPNGDGLNDLFTPISILNATPISLKVYNRSGRMLYSGNVSSSIGWDGTFHGAQQPTDTYLYILTYQDNEGITRTGKGNVTLIR